MKCKFLLLIGLMFSLTAGANEKISVDYKLNAKHGVDLSTFTRGPLKLETFQDARPEFSGEHINKTLSLKIPASKLLTQAIEQGFEQGGATLVTSDNKQTLSGQLIELNAESIDQDGDSQYQVTVRAKVQLKSATSSKTYWQSTIFGRARADKTEGIETAIQQALDKFVVGLFNDDYFLIELIE